MDAASTHAPEDRGSRAQRSARISPSVWSGVLFGVGAAAFLDEAIFHQVLHWHHFYDLATPDIGLVSDGLFHAVSWIATIAGLFLLADLRRRRVFVARAWWGGVLLGGGGFQLYDGTVQHKLLGIHQIRYVADVTVYDVVWNALAVLLIAAGVVLVVSSRRLARRA